jgi:acyl-CoA thioester hydrolase
MAGIVAVRRRHHRDGGAGTVAAMDWAVTYERKVRYSDTDAQGIVFNGNYATYFDDTMTDFFDLVGYTWEVVEVVLGRLEVDFRSPGRLGETLVTGARVEAFGNTSFTVRLSTWEKESERVVADAKQIQVVVDARHFRPVPVPADLVAAIEAAQAPLA